MLDNTGPTIYVFAGLPGVGKSSIAKQLAKRSRCFHLRVDAVEEPFISSGIDLTSQGYLAIRNLAIENAELGLGSIIDCVNPWPLTREMFNFYGHIVVTVEVFCSNTTVHQSRLNERGLGPTWQEVLDKEYVPWIEADYRFDTLHQTAEEVVEIIVS